MNTLSEDGQWMYDGSNWVPSNPDGPGNPPGTMPKMPMKKPPNGNERKSFIIIKLSN